MWAHLVELARDPTCGVEGVVELTDDLRWYKS